MNELNENFYNFTKNDYDSFLEILNEISNVLIKVLERLFESENSEIGIILGKIYLNEKYIIVYLDLE